MNAIRADFLLVRGMAVVSPLFPADVHFLGEESLLCQLQSCFCGELSIMTPAVGHDFLVFGKGRGDLVNS